MKERNLEVVTYCPFCGEETIVLVNFEDYADWQDGKLAQNAFPYLSADEREMLKTGICPTCWTAMFGFSDEEEEEEWDDDPMLDGPWDADPWDEDLWECDDDEDYPEYDEPADLEIGFDPYMGCYTEDC